MSDNQNEQQQQLQQEPTQQLDKELLNCGICNQMFNKTDREPKLLPCSNKMCLSCLKASSKKIMSAYKLECSVCKEEHNISDIDDVPTCNSVLFLLQHQSGQTEPELINETLQQVNKDLKFARYQIHTHYDDAINDVDLRAETLINSIHMARMHLQSKLNEDRKRSVQDFDDQVKKLNETNFGALSLKQAFNTFSMHESLLANVTQSMSYFSENSSQLAQLYPNLDQEGIHNNVLGHVLSKNSDNNYVKVKNLNAILTDETRHVRVKLDIKEKANNEILRLNVIPLSRNQILVCYFTHKRSLFFEMYDGQGKLVNSVHAYDNLCSFPVYQGYGNHFVVTFTSKTSGTSFYESNSTYILLYDANLTLIKMIKRFSSIESIYMNEKYVCLFYVHRSHSCCTLFDYQLNELNSFGQQTESTHSFYMEKSQPTCLKDQYKTKINPHLFGLTDNRIYLYNMQKMIEMNRHTGAIVSELKLTGDPSYFLLDDHHNIIQVQTASKRVVLKNHKYDLVVRASYPDSLDEVFLMRDNELAFVCKNKESVVFI